MTEVVLAVLPVFFVAAVGYMVGRFHVLDIKTLSVLNIYVLIPCLIYASLSPSNLDWSLFLEFFLAATVLIAVSSVVLSVVAHARGMDARSHGALLMTMFPNLGNFGLPVVAFAFGDEGLTFAVMILVIGSLYQNNLGVIFAHQGRGAGYKSLFMVFRYPMIYAFTLAAVASIFRWETPELLFRPVDIVAGAAIPIQLLIVGAKLAETRIDLSPDVVFAGSIRLMLGPCIAAGAAALVGIDGLPWQVFVLQMSGPIAVGMAVYGVQFDVRPGFLANAVSLSFVASVISVPVVLYLLLN